MAAYKQFRLGDLAPARVPLLSIVYPTGAEAQAARKALIERSGYGHRVARPLIRDPQPKLTPEIHIHEFAR
jgi:hypothetical protein